MGDICTSPVAFPDVKATSMRSILGRVDPVRTAAGPHGHWLRAVQALHARSFRLFRDPTPRGPAEERLPLLMSKAGGPEIS